MEHVVSAKGIGLASTASTSESLLPGVVLSVLASCCVLRPNYFDPRAPSPKSPPHLNQWNHKSNLYQFTISPLGKQKTQLYFDMTCTFQSESKIIREVPHVPFYEHNPRWTPYAAYAQDAHCSTKAPPPNRSGPSPSQPVHRKISVTVSLPSGGC